jgi:hypothetical protein
MQQILALFSCTRASACDNFYHKLMSLRPCSLIQKYLYTTGWLIATTASKGNLGKTRGLDSANKQFDTTYYNSTIRKASLAHLSF